MVTKRTNRVVLLLALPVTVFMFFLMVTLLVSWVLGTGLCDTWVASVLRYCV